MDIASLRLRIPLHRVPAPAEEDAQLKSLLGELGPFEGVMRTGSFNLDVADAMTETPWGSMTTPRPRVRS